MIKPIDHGVSLDKISHADVENDKEIQIKHTNIELKYPRVPVLTQRLNNDI